MSQVMAPPWLDVLDETIGACVTHRRPDLEARLREKRAQQLDPKLRVLVVERYGLHERGILH